MKRRSLRLPIQLAFTALSNGYLVGFAGGTLYQGVGKYVCLPGLNCYSCPGALGACPIGSLQAVLSGSGHFFSYYVLGFLILFGVVLGRLVCGFLCPFGLVQDLLHKIPLPKLRVPRRLDQGLRWLKYGIFGGLVVLAPLFLTNSFGIGTPYFCKWLCPSGTLLAGLPLLSQNDSLAAAAGALFDWKLGVLIVILLLCLFIYRPFCKYLCPLGAVYGLFSRLSLYQVTLDHHKCTDCKACERRCDMQVPITKCGGGNGECIRCGDCVRACPTGALQSGFTLRAAPTPRRKQS